MRRALFMMVTGLGIVAFHGGVVHAGDKGHKLAACKADVDKLCKDAPRGSGGVGRCLREHEAQLSEACKKAIDQVKAEREAMKQACAPDAERLCRDVGRGPGRVLGCLESHRNELGEACRKKLDERPRR